MKRIELVKGISSSVLGFGCAPVLGSVDAKKAKSAIECAIDYGINHFDLARSYGYGEAERFVGKIIKHRRDKLVLASKFGIKANWKAALLRPVKPFVRYVMDRKNLIQHSNESHIYNPKLSVADRFHSRINLNGNEMRKSLEQSLREVGTDYLDYFFIHEPTGKLNSIDELASTAEILKREGKIRAWGLAYMRDRGALHKAYINRFDVLQFNASPGSTGYEEVLKERSQKSNVIFSPFRDGSSQLEPAGKLKLLLSEFQNTVILCSMFNESHIKDNVLAVSS